jgi:hypothetical protein
MVGHGFLKGACRVARRETFRSLHGIGVDFDKISVFYGKYCVHIDKG